ncbi:MAG TPA: hypothetical protein VMH88_10115 [Gemmatimonadales bacterium]|nr:hypothetical protein [Gemmatimonadales bacterium]
MTFLAARIHHGFAPNSSREAAETVSTVLARPCFNLLTRLSATRHGLQVAFTPEDSGTLLAYLTRPENDAVLLDNGRLGHLQALARIQTGGTPTLTRPALRRPAPLLSYLMLPVTTDQIPDVLAATCDLAVALQGVAGAVTAVQSFEAAQAFALTKPAPPNGKTPPSARLRDRERSTLYYFLSQLDTLIPAPEWGLFLSSGHLEALPDSSLHDTAAFVKAQELVSGRLIFLQMTANPLDALTPQFDDRLGHARELLQPILMDASQVPEKA